MLSIEAMRKCFVLRICSVGDISGGLAVKTLHSNAGGLGLILDQGTKIPHSAIFKMDNQPEPTV